MAKIERAAYAEMFGPTLGDRVRLADTNLMIEIEKDFTIYGEEVKFGGGKVIRDGMGQSQRVSKDCADTVITNAVIIDHWGIVKADIAIKNGRIANIGKAGNPDIQPGVTAVIGPGPEIIAGEGMIVTPGGIGLYTLLVAQILAAYQVDDINAQAFGWIAWAVQEGIIVILGILSFIFIHSYNKWLNGKVALDTK